MIVTIQNLLELSLIQINLVINRADLLGKIHQIHLNKLYLHRESPKII